LLGPTVYYSIKPADVSWSVPLIASLTSFVAYMIYWILTREVYTRPHTQSGLHLIEDDVPALQGRIGDLFERVTSTQAEFFVAAYTDPKLIFERMSEVATPYNRSLGVTLSAVARLPTTPIPVSRVIPLAMFTRGQMEDGVKITVGDARGSSLNRQEAIAYVAAILRRLVFSADEDALIEYVEQIELQIVDILCSFEPADERSIRSLTDALWRLPSTDDGRAFIQGANDIIRRSVPHYPLLVEVTQDPTVAETVSGGVRLRLKLDRRVIVSMKRTRPAGFLDLFGRLRDELSKVLGVSSSPILIGLANAPRCQSFHLQVKGPQGSYLARQSIATFPSGEETQISTSYALRPRHGQRHSHLYMRDADDSVETMFFENQFFERLPGSLGYATMSALGAAVLISVASLIRLGIAEGEASDLVLGLLAFPAIAGAWLGLDSGQAVFGGTLAARLCNVATIVLSLGTAVLYMALPGADDTVRFQDVPEAGLWLLLAVLAVFNFVASAAAWSLRATVQRDFISRA
jgi:hypothetical protein